jgi:glycosyltransferase involved in cell wall biosynthesis
MSGRLEKASVKGLVCICGGVGFPFGTASSKRILLVARALASEGIPCEVWHLGPSFCPENRERRGGHQGIAFEYLAPTVHFSKLWMLRVAGYLWGCLVLPWRMLTRMRGRSAYVYYQGSLIHLWVLLVCRALGVPVIQEACEWWPDTPQRTRLNTWLYERAMFRWTAGALPISRHIEERIRRVGRPDLPLLRLPVLIDPLEARPHLDEPRAGIPRLLWCGSLYWFIRDASLLIQAGARLAGERRPVELILCGPSSAAAEDTLRREAGEAGFPVGQLRITGFIAEEELWRLCRSASVLLMTMWEDERSATRFPTKIGQYVAAGRPIVTAGIGEVAEFLTDGRTALFYRPGDVDDLAAKVGRILDAPELGEALAAAATAEVLPRLDYRRVAPSLARWVTEVTGRKAATHAVPRSQEGCGNVARAGAEGD